MTDQRVCSKCGANKMQLAPIHQGYVCQNCGFVQPLEQASLTPAPEQAGHADLSHRGAVFISYGREDALAFATRLAKDLRERGGCIVRMDLVDIETGGLWEVRIEQAIRTSSTVVVVMTHHALREESVCRDEVVFALNEGKQIVPLRVAADSTLKLPLLLARRNWLDFSQDYEAAFEALLRCLSGDRDALLPPLIPVVSGLMPLDFGPEIARLSVGFSGREWLNLALDDWLENSQGRMLVIVGEPGIGKSSIAAWLCRIRRDHVAAIHFCTHRNTRTIDAFEFVASIVGQLCSQLDDYEAALRKRHPEVPRPSASDAFRELVIEPAGELPPRAPILMIIDSLDEASASGADHDIVEVLSNQAEDLPSWLRIVATSRPDALILDRLQNLSILELKACGRENMDDAERYIRSRLQSDGFSKAVGAQKTDGLADRLLNLAQGNFLYARLALDALEDGSLALEDLGSLTPGLSGYYAALFKRMFKDVDVYTQDYQPLIRTLAASLEPLPFDLLQRVVGISSEILHRRVRRLTPFLHVSRRNSHSAYALFHRSLTDWLTDRDLAGDYWCALTLGHTGLAEVCRVEYSGGVEAMSPYAAKHLASHLAGAGRWDNLIAAVDDAALGLLARWTEQGGHLEGSRLIQGMITHLDREGRDPDRVACMMTQMARIHSQNGGYEEAKQWLHRALKKATGQRGRRPKAIALHELGSLCLYDDDLPNSERCYGKALRICTLGIPRLQDEASANLLGLAALARRKSHHGKAKRLARQALRKATAAKDVYHLTAAHRALAIAFKDMLRYKEAEMHLAQAEITASLVHAERESLANHETRGWINLERALLEGTSPETAEIHFQRAIEEAERIGLSACVAGAGIGMAWCALSQGDTMTARNRCQEAERRLATRQSRTLAITLSVLKAGIALQSGDLEAAGRLYRENLAVCRERDIPGEGSVAWSGLGATLWHAHQAVQAEEAWTCAKKMARRCSRARRRLTETGIERLRQDWKSVPF